MPESKSAQGGWPGDAYWTTRPQSWDLVNRKNRDATCTGGLFLFKVAGVAGPSAITKPLATLQAEFVVAPSIL
jgi:hypothetical protein